jgi:hypothetical protein
LNDEPSIRCRWRPGPVLALALFAALIAGCSPAAGSPPPTPAVGQIGECDEVAPIDVVVGDLHAVDTAARNNDIPGLKTAAAGERDRALVLRIWASRSDRIATPIGRAVFALGTVGDQGPLIFQLDYGLLDTSSSVLAKDTSTYEGQILPKVDSTVKDLATAYASAGLTCWHLP